MLGNPGDAERVPVAGHQKGTQPIVIIWIYS